ncbi:MAG: DUF4388 domain-containing protein [Labilithrix sp.]|nr:DUF4388 domain-containing protein [Labilithrix sp.]MCW5835236.1 DUF4388 domain-containing protein [Labilithrix sp.]
MSDRDDLLRVDGTGTVHPVGRAASQLLRPRAGEWRLIPSPRELIIARSMSGGDAVLRLAGEIRTPGALSDIVALAAQSQWTGELILLAEVGTRSFYFEHGTIIHASTTVAEERLGETLYRFGVITREQLDKIITVSTETKKRLGETAIDLGIVPADRLYAMMARQVEEVFYAAVHVSEGSFYFFDRYEEKNIIRRHNLNAGGLLIEAARRMDEMRFFREKIPNDGFIPVPVPGKKPPDDLVEMFSKIDGTRSIADLGRALGQLEFEVTRGAFQLVSSGCVFVVAPRPRGPEAIVETFNPALAAIHERCDGVGKGAELRDGLSRFATGGGIYDPLFMGAGPLQDGTLKPNRIANNIAALAGEEPDAWLVGLMNDYVGFALFQAESLLPRDQQSSLMAQVMDILKPVRPLLEAPFSRGAA